MYWEVLAACVNVNYQILDVEMKSWYFYCEIRQDVIICVFLYLALRPKAGQGLLIHEVYRSHTTTHHSR